MTNRYCVFGLAVCLLLLAAASAMAQPPITYQGQLKRSGTPYTGMADLQFRLYDRLSGGSQVGPTLVRNDWPVEDGLFQVKLDFGAADAFGPDPRWLEISVDGVVLDPRQRVTAVPVADRARKVADGAVGSTQIAPGAVGSGQLADDALTIESGTGLTGGGDVALGEATTIGIADGGVGIDQIAPGAVDRARIADGGVGTDQLAAGAVTSTKIAAGSVGSNAVVADSIGATQADSSQVQLRITGSCAPGTTLTGINADGSVVCSALPAPPTGLDFTADSEGDVGEYTAIAIRDSGLPIISYYDGASNDLKIYDCADAACSRGTARTLDETGDVGRYNAIAIRDSGRPIITYRDGGGDRLLKVYDCDNAECSSGTARTLDSGGDVGEFTAIAIRDSGLPIVSYFDDTNNVLKIYDCADAACSGTGTARILDNIGAVGLATAIAIRDSGEPIISYYDFTNKDLKIYDCADAVCSGTGTARTLDSGGDVGADTAIAIRDSGGPIIAHYDSTNGDLKVFDCDDAACEDGTARTLDNVGDFVGTDTAIAIRDSGLPIISYYDDTTEGLKVFDCTNDACSNGTARSLDSGGDVGEYSAIAIRDSGRPIISYYDDTNGDLKVYSCGDAGCGR